MNSAILYPSHPSVYCWLILFLSVLISPLQARERSVTEIAKLKGTALYDQIRDAVSHYDFSERKELSLQETRVLLECFRAEVQRAGFDVSAKFAFEALLRKCSREGDQNDFQILLRIWDSAGNNRERDFLPPLLDLAIRLEVESLNTNKALSKVLIPPHTGVVPNYLTNAPPQLISAWRQFQGLQEVVPKESSDTNQQWIRYLENTSNFCNDISGLLHDRTNALERIRLYQWGNWCGTGSEVFKIPQNQSLLLGHLKLKQMDGALSLVFQVPEEDNWRMMSLNRHGEDQWQRALITACGMDWEELYVGAFLTGNSWRYRASGKVRILARHGSAKAAEYLAAMENIEIEDSWSNEEYLTAVSKFIEPVPHQRVRYSSADYERVATSKIPDGLQEKLLKILCKQLRPEAGPHAGAAAAQALGDLARPETKAALKQALQSPFNAVREAAFEALQGMGEKINPPTPIPPIRYQILTNGTPLKNLEIGWTLQGKDGSTSSSDKLNSSGILSLNPDDFAEASRGITNINLELGRSLEDSPPSKVFWFSVDAPLPADRTATTRVDIAIAALRLKPVHPRPSTLSKEEPVTIEIETHDGEYPESISGDPYSTEFADTILFPALQANRKYSVKFLCTGAAVWNSGPFVLGTNGLVLPIRLEPGADISCSISMAGSDSHSYFPRQLYRITGDKETEEYEQFEKGWRSLPVGKYRLHVLSSAEIQSQRDKNEIIEPNNQLNYHGTNVFFTIEPTSAPRIELDPIDLRAAGQ